MTLPRPLPASDGALGVVPAPEAMDGGPEAGFTCKAGPPAVVGRTEVDPAGRGARGSVGAPVEADVEVELTGGPVDVGAMVWALDVGPEVDPDAVVTGGPRPGSSRSSAPDPIPSDFTFLSLWSSPSSGGLLSLMVAWMRLIFSFLMRLNFFSVRRFTDE